MGRILMTDKALEKVQTLANNQQFKNSLNNFAKISQLYTNKNKVVPSRNLLNWSNRRLVKKVHNLDDVFMFRDKNNRFFFTIQNDESDNSTAILLDVIGKKEAETQLTDLYSSLTARKAGS
jgi:hypothetical protein